MWGSTLFGDGRLTIEPSMSPICIVLMAVSVCAVEGVGTSTGAAAFDHLYLAHCEDYYAPRDCCSHTVLARGPGPIFGNSLHLGHPER